MNPQVTPSRLYRSNDDRVISGIAGGMAEYFDMDPALVRVLWVLSVFVTGSVTLWIYIVRMLGVPTAPSDWPGQTPWAPGGAPVGTAPSGYSANYAPPGSGPAPADAAPSGPAPAGSAPAADPSATSPGTPPPPAPGGWQSGWQGWQGGPWNNDWRSQRHQERWQRRQERWQQRTEDAGYHSFGGPGIVFGLMLVLVGGLLAWHQFDPNFDFNVTWPVAIIALGAILVASSLRFKSR